MNVDVPVAIEQKQGGYQHFVLRNAHTCNGPQFFDLLEAAGQDSPNLYFNGKSPEHLTKEDFLNNSNGMILSAQKADSTWCTGFGLKVLSGPATGQTHFFDSELVLADVAQDPFVAPDTQITFEHGLKLYRNRAFQNLQIGEPFSVGSSVFQVVLPDAETVDTPNPEAVELPDSLRMPNRNYRFYFAISLAPMIIALILMLVTDMWYFMLFALLGAVAGLIPFFQGKSAWTKYETALQNAAHTASQRQQQIFLGSERDSDAAQILLCLGFGAQDLPINVPKDIPAKLEPEPFDFAPVLISLGCTQLVDERFKNTNHMFQRVPTLWVEADRFRQTGIILDLLSQVLNKVDATVTLTISDQLPSLSNEIGPWLSFFPKVRLKLDSAAHTSIEIHGLTGLQDHECITIAISEHPSHTDSPHWLLQANRHQLQLVRPLGVSDPVSIPSLRSMEMPTFISNVARVFRPSEITQASIHSLPSRSNNRWSSLVSVLGSKGSYPDSQPMTLDLVDVGPHMLIVGTTGSGKSVLLQRLVLEWVARYSPDNLNLILVDFKGGATFAPFTSLPHVSGHLNDLDAENTPRLLAALRFELARREQLFMDHGVSNYLEYRQSVGSSLPRFAVMIDEFAVFAADFPEALDELIHLGTVGRSLGFHLVLATQRSAGSVTNALKTNISAKICLRVTQPTESVDLVGTDAAAKIRTDQPGLGFISTPGMAATAFQTRLFKRTTPASLVRQSLYQQSSQTDSNEELRLLLKELAPEDTSYTPEPILRPSLPEVLRLKEHTCFGLTDEPSKGKQDYLYWLNDRRNSLGNSIATLTQQGSNGLIRHLLQPAMRTESQANIVSHDTFYLASTPDYSFAKPLGGFVQLGDFSTAEEILKAIESETSKSPERPRLLIIEDLDRWLKGAEQNRHFQFQQIVHDLLHIASRPSAKLFILFTAAPNFSNHQLVHQTHSQIFLSAGVSEQQRMLWPNSSRDSSTLGRGVITGPGFPEHGTTIQVPTDHEPEKENFDPVTHIRSALPHRIELTDSTETDRTVSLGVTGLEHTVLRRKIDRPFIIIGTPQSGKTELCRAIHQQTCSQVTVLDDLENLSTKDLQELELQLVNSSRFPFVASVHPESLTLPHLSFLRSHLRRGTHVLLKPSAPQHFDVFGVIQPPAQTHVPGRGFLIEDGKTVLFQAFMPKVQSHI